VLLLLAGLPYTAIPTIALSLNVVVTLTSIVILGKGHNLRFNLIWPFLVTSIPCAYIGGTLQVSAQFFLIMLAIILLLMAVQLIFPGVIFKGSASRPGSVKIFLLVGAILGFTAGVVGIGGGILLVPLIITLGWATEREAAGIGSWFIFLNSLAGLAGRIQWQSPDPAFAAMLGVAVLIGGLVGANLASNRLSPIMARKFLGVVLLLALVSIGNKLI
ncbi:TSUP family transporter, partial [Candidatus Neomarinimicrobiota bacterium]